MPPPDDLAADPILLISFVDDLPGAELYVLHVTVNAALRGRVLGEVRVLGARGQAAALPVVYGQNVSALSLPEWLATPEGGPVHDTWPAWTDDAGGQPRALWATRLKLPAAWQPDRVQFVPTAAGQRTGWTVLALSVTGSR